MGKQLLALLAVPTALGVAACHHHDHFGSRVDVEVEVTAPSGPVSFVGTVSSLDQDDIDFSGTTPFRADFSRRRLPVDVFVRRVTRFGIPLILCVTDLDSGRQRCRETAATSVDVEI